MNYLKLTNEVIIMSHDFDFRTLNVKSEIHDKIRSEAKARGMKIHTLADEMVRMYFKNKV